MLTSPAEEPSMPSRVPVRFLLLALIGLIGLAVVSRPLVHAQAPPADTTASAAPEIGTGLRGGSQVVVADLNKDGKPDIIALASGLPELLWYENPGWQKDVLATGRS